MDFTSKVLLNIQKQNLVKYGDKIIVGISGGADSVALLQVFSDLQHKLGIRLHAAHFNHNLRRGADTDQRFVEKLCGSLNIPITVKKWTDPKRKTDKGSLEDKARKQRLCFFEEVASREKADCVALAHHKDDSAETVLMRIIRGTGLQGLRGIMPVKKIHNLTIIRPFLNVSRKDVENFLTKKKMGFRSDPTNQKKDFTRNKIRLDILPFLKKYNPDIDNILVNLGSVVEADYDFLETQANKELQTCILRNKGGVIKLNAAKLIKLHVSLRRMVIRQTISLIKGDTTGINLNNVLDIEKIIAQSKESKIELTDLLVNKSGNEIIFKKNLKLVERNQRSLSI